MSTVDFIFWGGLLIALIFTSKIVDKRKLKLQRSTDKFLTAYNFEKVISISSELYRNGFSIFDYNEYETVENIVKKENRTDEIYMFDFKCAYNHGSRTATQRAIFIRFPNHSMYNFDLKPESVFDKIKQKFGSEDIDFQEFKEFSKKYALHSQDRKTIEANFPNELIKILENKDGVYIESRKNCMLIYSKVNHEFSEYEPLYKEAIKYKELLLASI
jgi:hypothetical protein